MHRTFQEWLAVSEEHAGAYTLVCSGRRAALKGAGGPKLFTVPSVLALRAPSIAKRAKPKRSLVLVALALVVALLAGLALAPWRPRWSDSTRGEVFRTGIGLQADSTLPVGSVVTLDTASSLTVNFTRSHRAVTLAGQGWFDVEPSMQPFVIDAGGRTFNAATGAFDVRTDDRLVRAYAASGTLTDDATAATVRPGQLFAIRGNTVLVSKPADTASLTAWRSGLLLFHETPFSNAAAELNRYREQPIRIADQHAAALRISGAFSTTGATEAIATLTRDYPLRIEQYDAKALVIGSR